MSSEAFFSNATVSALISAVVAWVVAEKLQKRALRAGSEEAIFDLLVDLKHSARDYWRKNGQDAALEAEIVRGILRVREKLLRFDCKYLSRREESKIKARTLQLHNELTGGPFATAGRVRDPQRLSRGELAISALQAILT